MNQLQAERKEEDVAREGCVSKHAIYASKAEYGAMDLSQAREAKQLRDENTRLPRLVPDQIPDKDIFQAVIATDGGLSGTCRMNNK